MVDVGTVSARRSPAWEVCGPERDRLWRKLNEVFDSNAYQLAVSRRLAIVALSPVG